MPNVQWWGKTSAVFGVRPGNTLWNHSDQEGDSQTIDTYHLIIVSPIDIFASDGQTIDTYHLIIVSPIDIFASDASENRTCVAEISS